MSETPEDFDPSEHPMNDPTEVAEAVAELAARLNRPLGDVVLEIRCGGFQPEPLTRGEAREMAVRQPYSADEIYSAFDVGGRCDPEAA